MRTTLTLDEDVAALLKRVLRGRKDSLKGVINEALRLGLRRMSSPPERKASYRTPSLDLGRCRVPNLDNIAEVLDEIDGASHK